MALWLARAGRHGERENFALENNIAVVGWGDMGDLRETKSRELLLARLAETYPDEDIKTLRNWQSQLWAFSNRIEVGDWVALPLKTRSAVAFGEVTGDYAYVAGNPEDSRQTRPVRWLKTDIPRGAIDQDILFSLGAFMTVCQIRRNGAEERVKALVNGTRLRIPTPAEASDASEDDTVVNLDEFARDQIRTHLSQKFRGHDLSRLVGALLEAQGYHAQVAPPGTDGGVDVLAGKGAMGFDHPRLVVQVKSQDSPVGVSVLRELQGVMKNFGAEQGLLVAWGGFQSTVITESRHQFFELRLWDADDLITAVTENYERLSADLQADIPLKRVWALVVEE
jgi:restriction system protein